MNTDKESILLAHTADWHYLSRQFGVPSRGDDVADAVRRAVSDICSLPAESRPDAIVNVGDIFHESRPTAKVIRHLKLIDRTLRRNKMPMICVTGNHDWSSPTWLDTLFPDPDLSEGGVYPVDGSRVELKGFVIHGVIQASAGVYREREDEIMKEVEGADVVLFHALVDGIVPHSIDRSTMLKVEELPCHVPGVKLIALGDVHATGYVTQGDCLVGYPGSVEMISKSESTEKKIPMIRVTRSAAVVESLLPLSIRPFVAHDVDTKEDLDVLMSRIDAVADQHPVVLCEFNRELTETVTRVYGRLDAQRSVIRLTPAPRKAEEVKRQRIERGGVVTLETFVRKRFSQGGRIEDAAVALVSRGAKDAPNIVTDFIAARRKELSVRE